MHNDNDKFLFTAISKGDEAAFKELFDIYKHKLFGLTVSLTKSTFLAEELLQEVFTSLWVSRLLLAEVQDPAAYIYQSAYHKIRQLVKKERDQRHIIAQIQSQASAPSQADDPEISLLLAETKRILQEAINQLPEQKKKIYQLAKIEGLSYQQISKALNISPNTVRNHLVEAARLIRVHFTKAGMASLLPILTILLDR